MSTIKANNHQIGQSATATNNFTLYQPTSPDGTVRLAVGNSGATTSDVMTVANTGAVTFSGSVTATGGFIGAGLSLQSVQTSNFAATKGNSYPVNTTSGAVTVTFPASPAAGDQINIFDYAGTAATYNITIDPNGGKITGGTANVALNVQRISVTFTYVNSTQGWEPVTYNAYQNLNGKSWTYFTSSGTYTVPAGVTSVRGYAGGAGGNGAGGSGVGGAGAGGGFAFGDIAVTAGQTMTITISAGVATLAIGATTYLTANPGGNGSGNTGGTGGTASKHVSVTNGGAYSGGAGGDSTGVASAYAGGGSCGSPLGNGYKGGSATGINQYCGGAGIGGAGGGGANYGSGGGAGGAGRGSATVAGGGGAGGAAPSGGSGGPGRAFNARFTDPLLVNAVSPGGAAAYDPSLNRAGAAAGPGGGGGAGDNSGAAGGDFGGGGSFGPGGLMGGGSGGSQSGGLGGGGGSSGTGGGAFVFIYA